MPINSVVTCNEIDSAMDACIDGLGLGMFLSYMVAPYRKDGRLKYLLEKFETEPVPVQVDLSTGAAHVEQGTRLCRRMRR